MYSKHSFRRKTVERSSLIKGDNRHFTAVCGASSPFGLRNLLHDFRLRPIAFSEFWVCWKVGTEVSDCLPIPRVKYGITRAVRIWAHLQATFVSPFAAFVIRRKAMPRLRLLGLLDFEFVFESAHEFFVGDGVVLGQLERFFPGLLGCVEFL